MPFKALYYSYSSC